MIWDGLPIHVVPCKYCSVILPRQLWTVDHVIAQARGGRNYQDNLVVACRHCNSKKRDYALCGCGSLDSTITYDRATRYLVVCCAQCQAKRLARHMRLRPSSTKKIVRKQMWAEELERRRLLNGLGSHVLSVDNTGSSPVGATTLQEA